MKKETKFSKYVKALKDALNPKKAYVFEHDGVLKELNPKKKFKLEELQAFVGGHIEIIYNLPMDKMMVINEEGKLQQLPYNLYATNLALLNHSISTEDDIAGNAVILNNNQID